MRPFLDACIAASAAWILWSLTTGARAVIPAAIVLAVLVAVRVFVRPGSRGDVGREAVLIASLLSVIYLANGRTLGSGDTLPARYLGWALLARGTLRLDEPAFLHQRCVPYFLEVVDGHYVTPYPVGAALAALPFHVLPVLGGVDPSSPFYADLEKLAAAVIAAVSAGLLYAAARRLARRATALLVVTAYGLGSSTLSVSSQGLWQHGPAQLALTLALYALVRTWQEDRHGSRWVAVAGLGLGLAVICRPSTALLALPLAAYIAVRQPARIVWLAVGALPPLAFQAGYHTVYFGDPFHLQWPVSSGSVWGTPLTLGLAGVLGSPARGLFLYSPIFLLSAGILLAAWRAGGDLLLRCAGIGVLATVLLVSKWQMWWGGFTFGPRLLADLTPLLALALAWLDGALARHAAWRIVVVLLLAWSIGAHAVGAFAHDLFWNAYRDVDRRPGHLWSWTDNQVVNPFRQVARRLMTTARGAATSRTAPALLAASYPPIPELTVSTSAVVELAVKVENSGRAAWLAWPRHSPGAVRLAWRWIDASGQAIGPPGSLPLYRDVLPGEPYEFAMVPVQAPPDPGPYHLEVGLVVRQAGCFAEFPTRRAEIAITVVPGAPPLAAGGLQETSRRAPLPACGRSSLATDGVPAC